MSAIHDGGPAFPRMLKVGEVAKSEGGMSMRDYAAIHADLGELDLGAADAAAKFMGEPNPTTLEEAFGLSARLVARLRYLYADAMLAEREASR